MRFGAPEVTHMFSLPEPELAVLEEALPKMYDLMLPDAKNRADVQIMVEEVKRVLSDVRWDYGPYQTVTVIPCSPPEAA